MLTNIWTFFLLFRLYLPFVYIYHSVISICERKWIFVNFFRTIFTLNFYFNGAVTKNGDRIKGLKLRHINAYCKCRSTRVAAVHEGEKESLVYCGSSTAAAAVHKILFSSLVFSGASYIWLLWLQYTSRSTRGIKEYLVNCGAFCTATPQLAVVGKI